MDLDSNLLKWLLRSLKPLNDCSFYVAVWFYVESTPEPTQTETVERFGSVSGKCTFGMETKNLPKICDYDNGPQIDEFDLVQTGHFWLRTIEIK